MKVMLICGVFAKENEKEVIQHAHRPVEFSANVFQTKLICGFVERGIDIQVLSAPFIGSFPNASDIPLFSGFSEPQSEYSYVPFNNLWGVRNLSRASALKKKLGAFIHDPDPQKLIVVYSPHTPFLEAAVYAKKRDARIKICLLVPDLPQYMNLDARISLVYKCGKGLDVLQFNRLTPYVDSFVVLTDAMKEKLGVGDRPCAVVEGIVDQGIFKKNESLKKSLQKNAEDERYIVYTGKTNERFGIKKLVDAFAAIPEQNLRLVLCGKGDCDDYIVEEAKRDPRIIALGQVPHTTAAEWVQKADVLVNPRENNEVYTKYSFPSKTIEYLASGNPVVGYMLDGMPEIYQELLLTADSDGLEAAIRRALLLTEDEKEARFQKGMAYLQTLEAGSVAAKILCISSCA